MYLTAITGGLTYFLTKDTKTALGVAGATAVGAYYFKDNVSGDYTNFDSPKHNKSHKSNYARDDPKFKTSFYDERDNNSAWL
jgi:formylmethanofuran:tetrahydromethanopterin formyltransferase